MIRILLADDERDNREMLARRLRRRQFDVAEAADGVETLQIFSAERFDLVLMDVSMPKMDGFMATRAIREWESDGRQRTPVIALTAHAMQSTRNECLAAGCDAFTTKPIDFPALIALIETQTFK